MNHPTPSSNTSIREEFLEKFPAVCDALEDSIADKIADWWLSKREEWMNEKAMSYLQAFGQHVPLGGDDIEPEKMAEVVLKIWGDKSREEERREMREGVENIPAMRIKAIDSENRAVEFQGIINKHDVIALLSTKEEGK